MLTGSNATISLRAIAFVVTALFIVVLAPTVTADFGTGLLSQSQFDIARQIVQADDQNFAAFSVDWSKHTLKVYRVSSRIGSSAEAALTQRLEQLAASSDGSPKLWSLAVVDVAHSGADLANTQSAVVTQQPWLRDATPYLAAAYVDPSINAVAVELTSVTPGVKSDAAAFGDRVRLITVSGRPAPASKTYDGAPWWGGSSITVGSNGCTSGFPAKNRSNGHQGMLTAGHCGGNGATVHQASSVMGTVTFNRYGGGSWDVDFVDAPGGVQGYVYNYENSWLPMHGFSSAPLAGNRICTDGYVTGQNCTGVIQQTDVCVWYIDGTFLCGLDYANSSNGSVMTQHGDSGGPVYHGDGNGGVIADGIISGNSNYGNPNPDVYFTPYGLASGGNSPTPVLASFYLVCVSGC